MTADPQNPGRWDNLALLGVVQGSNKCRTACPTMKVERCRCAKQWSGILAWIAAREAAARREGIEAAAHAAETCLHPSAERTAHAAVDDAAAAIRALLEGAPRAVAEAKPVARRPECVERWSDCADGEYDPRCCRWPKSCSCALLEDGR